MSPRPLAAAALGLLLLTAPAMAQSSNDPIPGIDIIVKKNPGGSALVVGQTGRDGWHRGPVRVEAGTYQVSAGCPPRRECPVLRLAALQVDGRMIRPDARGQYVFPVGPGVRQVRLEAQVVGQTTPTPR